MQTVQIIPGPGPETGTHSHDFLEFQAVLAGAVPFRCRGETILLGPGDVFFAPCRMPHSAPEQGAKLLTVRLGPGWLFPAGEEYAALLSANPDAFDCFALGDSGLFSLLQQLEAVCREETFGWELCARGLALEIMGAVFGRHFRRERLSPTRSGRDSGEKYARWVREHLEQHYHSSIDLDQIAAELGLTKGYVCRLFKQHTGTTIIHYVNLLRCRHAIELVEGGCSITQAALQVGFNDYNYFSRVFKKTIGRRPSDFIHNS